ncbi:MAG: DUF3500 domain-containing protein [Planctomycetales bacterium]|nr:DUF3500 domain-containing protein [Planctomycetales bacterium]
MRRFALCLIPVLVIGASSAFSNFKHVHPAAAMTMKAGEFLASLSREERATAQLPYDTPQRVGWHFIPKNDRKGLQMRDMSKPQRKLARQLVHSALSQLGYRKASEIMKLESILHDMEKSKPGGNIRDSLRYYVTIFGEPESNQRWGLSFEGHHMSLNFVVEGERVVSSTPQFFGSNPATIQGENVAGFEKGYRVLGDEEALAFELVNSLDEAQLAAALIDEKAPREIRAAGEAQPPTDPAAGLAAKKMNAQQRKLLDNLIGVYAAAMPDEVASARLRAIDEAGREQIHFAWAGARQAGIGHYYRIEGATFQIELVNTQPDPAGNTANHVHCIWRDAHGDFALPLK